MAKKRILGLEITSQEIRYVYLERIRRRILVSKTGKFSPPNLSSLKELLTQENLSPSKICISLSGEDLLIHQINLPKMPESELDEVIRSEIERIPKFSHKEFDYIYSLVKLDDLKCRALFCAIAKESLDSYIQGLQNIGIPLERLEISPLNLLEILYGRIDKDKAEGLVVLDRNSSSIMIFGQNECKLFSQPATGKEDLYSSTGQINQVVFSNWIDEIRRILKSYQREFPKQPVQRLWCIWDNERPEGLAEMMSKGLDIEVSVPKPEDFGIELADKDTVFNPIYFLSLAGPLISAKGIKQRFDFRHFLASIKLKEMTRKVVLFVLLYLLILGSLLGIISFSYFSAREKILTEEKEMAERMANLEAQTMELKKERNDYLDTKDRLLSQAGFVKMLNRISWSEIFAKVSSVLPENVSLSSFDVSESGQVKIQGDTFNIDSIAELIRKINAVAFLEEAQFDFLREREVENKKLVEFGIVTRLKIEKMKKDEKR